MPELSMVLDSSFDVALPVEFKVPLVTYVDHAYLLGMLWNTPGVRTRFSHFYINIAFPLAWIRTPELVEAAGHEKTDLTHLVCVTPSIELPQWSEMGYIKLKRYDAEFIEGCTKERLIDFLCEQLRGGRFIWMKSDDYWIPRHAEKPSAHLRHTLLLTGYSVASKRFLAATFGRDGQYAYVGIGFEDLAESLQGSIDQLDLYFISIYVSPVGTGDDIDHGVIRRQLENYVRGEASSGEYPWCTGFTLSEPAAYGIDFYRALQIYFENCEEKHRVPDVRVTRHLWEHKQMMLSRMFLCRNVMDESAVGWIGRGLRTVERLIRAIHQSLYLRQIGAEPLDTGSISKRLEICEKLEKAAMEEWVERLRV